MKIGRDIEVLLRKLILGYTTYFSYDVLNSEGRKIFEEMARMLIDEHPEIKPSVKRVRRKPTFENIVRLASRVLGEKEVEELTRLLWQGPYKYGLEKLL